jgi:aerobic C4-dicarboxylate transport protein
MTLASGAAVLPESALSSSLVTVFLRNTTMHLLLAGLVCGIGLVWAGAKARRVLHFVERGNIMMGKLVDLVLLLAPLATFCAIAVTVSSTGMSALSPLLQLLGTIYLSSFAFVLVVLGAVAWCCGYKLWHLVLFLRDELMIVIGTSSSITALPRLVEKLEQLGCAPQLVRATMSAGFCVNLNGSNIYLMGALLFLAQAARIDLDAGQYLFILAAAMITSKGACGVAGSSFLALGATLVVLPGVPASGLLAVFAIERLLKCRSLTNFLGNGVVCIALCTWMKQIERATLVSALAPRQVAKRAGRPHT